mmetsp:Transcript_41088/g.48013  ORF Transcript_41088/g.48013 Transcript_41088/m.48013 type:complete len:120 (+) Transcript_41088:28-387(+)
MWFCPLDGTLLQIQIVTSSSGDGGVGHSIFTCSTCPYSCDLLPNSSVSNFTKKMELQRKAVDDILGGADAWKNVDKTSAVCGKCSHGTAYFMQMQIRSADEPMSVFYKCCKCGNQWNDK